MKQALLPVQQAHLGEASRLLFSAAENVQWFSALVQHPLRPDQDHQVQALQAAFS